MVLVRESGDVRSTVYSTFESSLEIDLRRVQEMSQSDLEQAISPMIDRIIDQQRQTLFDSINEESPTFQHKDGESMVEAHLRALDEMIVPFDDFGRHNTTLVIPPALADRLREELERSAGDMDYQRRYSQTISKKRMEWHDREASRRLVD